MWVKVQSLLLIATSSMDDVTNCSATSSSTNISTYTSQTSTISDSQMEGVCLQDDMGRGNVCSLCVMHWM